MSARISLNQWLRDYWEDSKDYYQDDSDDELLTALNFFSDQELIPALCKHGCLVALDGTCKHGNPSPLISLGLIRDMVEDLLADCLNSNQ